MRFAVYLFPFLLSCRSSLIGKLKRVEGGTGAEGREEEPLDLPRSASFDQRMHSIFVHKDVLEEMEILNLHLYFFETKFENAKRKFESCNQANFEESIVALEAVFGECSHYSSEMTLQNQNILEKLETNGGKLQQKWLQLGRISEFVFPQKIEHLEQKCEECSRHSKVLRAEVPDLDAAREEQGLSTYVRYLQDMSSLLSSLKDLQYAARKSTLDQLEAEIMDLKNTEKARKHAEKAKVFKKLGLFSPSTSPPSQVPDFFSEQFLDLFFESGINSESRLDRLEVEVLKESAREGLLPFSVVHPSLSSFSPLPALMAMNSLKEGRGKGRTLQIEEITRALEEVEVLSSSAYDISDSVGELFVEVLPVLTASLEQVEGRGNAQNHEQIQKIISFQAELEKLKKSIKLKITKCFLANISNRKKQVISQIELENLKNAIIVISSFLKDFKLFFTGSDPDPQIQKQKLISFSFFLRIFKFLPLVNGKLEILQKMESRITFLEEKRIQKLDKLIDLKSELLKAELKLLATSRPAHGKSNLLSSAPLLLTDSLFTLLSSLFESQHQGLNLLLDLARSQELLAQLEGEALLTPLQEEFRSLEGGGRERREAIARRIEDYTLESRLRLEDLLKETEEILGIEVEDDMEDVLFLERFEKAKSESELESFEKAGLELLSSLLRKQRKFRSQIRLLFLNFIEKVEKRFLVSILCAQKLPSLPDLSSANLNEHVEAALGSVGESLRITPEDIQTGLQLGLRTLDLEERKENS